MMKRIYIMKFACACKLHSTAGYSAAFAHKNFLGVYIVYRTFIEGHIMPRGVSYDMKVLAILFRGIFVYQEL